MKSLHPAPMRGATTPQNGTLPELSETMPEPGVRCFLLVEVDKPESLAALTWEGCAESTAICMSIWPDFHGHCEMFKEKEALLTKISAIHGAGRTAGFLTNNLTLARQCLEAGAMRMQLALDVDLLILVAQTRARQTFRNGSAARMTTADDIVTAVISQKDPAVAVADSADAP